MIKINNKEYNSDDVAINNGKVIIDGKDVIFETEEASITIEGDLRSLSVDRCTSITIKGNCGNAESLRGDILVEGDVAGDVTSRFGTVSCQEVKGNIITRSGNISTSK